MKQSKRFLAVLLAMILAFTGFSVAASAIKEDYSHPAGYDSIKDPYFTNGQAASALLDMLDDLLGEKVNLRESYVGIDINIYSIDSTFDTVVRIFDKVGFLAGLAGDVKKLDIDAIDNNIRRRNNYTDLQVFNAFCEFAADNASVLSGIVDNSIDLGVVDLFFKIDEEVPMIKNLHGYICDMLYKLLVDENGTSYQEGDSTDSYNLDNILQDWLNNRVLTFVLNLLDEETVETVVDFLGINVVKDSEGKITNQMGLLTLLPSLSANDISITTTSTYDFIINIFNALIDDIVIPFGGKLLLELLEIDPEDRDAEELSYVDIAIGLFVDAQVLKDAGAVPADVDDNAINVTEEFLRWKGVEDPTHPLPLEKINVTLEYILHVGIKKFIHFVGTPGVDSHLELTEYFSGMFTDLIKSVMPILPTLASDFKPLTSDEEAALETMTDEQVFAFLAKMLLEAFVDGVYFPEDCDSITSLATYTLINLCEEYVHSEDADFQQMIDDGIIDPESKEDCLNIAASVINYFLVGETTYESTDLTPTLDELADGAFETFLGKYITLFSIYDDAHPKSNPAYGKNPWFKLYRTVNAWIPLTNIIYGVSDSAEGMKSLLLDSIIGNVLDFDIGGILGIIGRRPDSDLNKPFSRLVANLLARILNGVFKLPTETDAVGQIGNNAYQKNLIVPYAYTTLDQIITVNNSSSGVLNGTGLKRTVEMLLHWLPNVCQSGAVVAESLDVICTLAKIIDLDDFEYYRFVEYADFPSNQSYSINELKTLYNNVKPSDNEGIKYYDDAYQFCEIVDYDPWTFKDFEDALDNAEDVIKRFDNNQKPARSEITYAYFFLDTVNKDYLLSNQPAANDYYLNKFMAKNARITANIDENGNQKYTNRSWDDYVKAYNFAEKVETEYAQYERALRLGDYPQSKVNTARSMLRNAIRGLKLNAGLGDADYDALLSAIANLAYLSKPSIFTDKSVQNVVDTYNEALAFVREVWYDADSQAIVDGVTERLNKAYDSLVELPLLVFDDTFGIVTDEVNSYVYGLPEDYYNEMNKMDYPDDFTTYLSWELFAYFTQNCIAADIVPVAGGNGSGTKIKLLSDDDGDGVMKTEREYTVVIFGDASGDTFVNGMDSVVLKAYASNLLEVNNATAYMNIAGDAKPDGFLDIDDALLLEQVGVKKQTIDQDATARMGEEVAFTDIVNK